MSTDREAQAAAPTPSSTLHRGSLQPSKAIKKAKKCDRRMLKKIARAQASGDKRTLRHLTRLYVNSFSARVAAAEAMNRKRSKRTKARKTTPDSRLSRLELIELAGAINPYRHSSEPVVIFGRRKPDGGVRILHSYGRKNRALQQLVKSALSTTLELDPAQFALRGGRTAAVAAVRSILMHDPKKYVVLADVTNCFGSLSHEWIERNLGLPRVIIRQVVLGRAIYDRPGFRRAVSDFPELRQLTIGGIPQGSAVSSIVSEIALSEFVRQVRTTGAPTVNYSDNFFVFANSLDEAARLAETLTVAARDYPAGSLELRTVIRPVRHWFHCLGYNIIRHGSVRLEPTLSRLEAIHAKVESDLAGFGSFADARLRVESFAVAFSEWDEGELWRTEQLERISQIETTGVDPWRRTRRLPNCRPFRRLRGQARELAFLERREWSPERLREAVRSSQRI